MCLAVPGKIVSVGGEGLSRTGRVSFGGTLCEVSLACTPEARVGNYVVVHVGLALSVIDESEALRTLEIFREMHEAGKARDQ